jgi:CSLREA domain-containing protein
MRRHLTALINRFTVMALLVALIGSGVQVTPVYAASIVVNSNADTQANDGVCTLREAIIAANIDARSGTLSGECAAGSSGADAISFAGNYVITMGSQLPFVTTAMTITGKGAANTIIQAAATPNTATWRVLQVTSTGNLTLDGVTVRNGRCNNSCTELGTTDQDPGGGIYNSGILTVVNSTFAANSANYGGSIYSNSGTLTVINNTFLGNTAALGGGIYSKGTLTVTNSTFAANSANYGGGIYNSDTSTVTNSTLSGNTASTSGGGIYNNATITLKNTIVANNSGGNCGGTLTNGGYNLDSGITCGWGSTNGSMSNTNPMLGALSNNGGPTQTMALLAGSPAIDAIPVVNSSCDSTGVITDQRGGSRLQGACDIGAYEFGATLPTFSDVPVPYWAWDFIERLYKAGITGGCSSSPLQYCPETVVTRAQMAVFLLRGIHGSSYAPPAVGGSTGFSDVPINYWAATWIKQLAAEGITGGCGSGNYCPETPVTRAQMAIFLLRSKHDSSYTPPAVGEKTGFGDVPINYWAAAWIKQLVAEGITAGCGGGNYCPETQVTRAQMAVFLVRTFNLP